MSTFRQATQPQEPPATTTTPPKSEGETTSTTTDFLFTYEQERGYPFIAEYLGMSATWDKEHNTRSELRRIEDFLKKEVERGKLDNDTRAATKYLKEMEKKSEVRAFESIPNKIEKLLAYIEFRKIVDEPTNTTHQG